MSPPPESLLKSLPSLNAVLNSASAVLLSFGYYFIRTKQVARHRICMIAAFTTSCVFLASYLTYHAFVGVTRFPGTGWQRVLYYSVLTTHTALAAAVAPMAIITLVRALRERFDRHRKIARWTLPIWIYVSVTGVLVYLMLYHWFAPVFKGDSNTTTLA